MPAQFHAGKILEAPDRSTDLTMNSLLLTACYLFRDEL